MYVLKQLVYRIWLNHKPKKRCLIKPFWYERCCLSIQVQLVTTQHINVLYTFQLNKLLLIKLTVHFLKFQHVQQLYISWIINSNHWLVSVSWNNFSIFFNFWCWGYFLTSTISAKHILFSNKLTIKIVLIN